MSARGRDGAELLLDLATAGLPARRAPWGAAMRAELATVGEPRERRRFARSAAVAALRLDLGFRVSAVLAASAVVALVVLTASRAQLPVGGPGVLPISAPAAAVPVLAVAMVTAWTTRSFLFGLETGLLAVAACLAAVFLVLAVEGPVWMQRHGAFMLDGDPPKQAVGTADVVFDLFTTGMWVALVISWLPWTLLGAGLGTWLGGRRSARSE